MKKTAVHLIAASAVLLTLSCGRPARPPELTHAESVGTAPATRDAATLAPQAVAHAEQLVAESRKAYENGEIAGATILAERAIVAYERAAVLARLARANANALGAARELAASEASRGDLEAELQRVEADGTSLENLINVMRGAESPAPSGPVAADRALARLEASRSIAADARLLCVATSLLNKPADGLSEALAELARLEESIAKQTQPAPIDDTMRLRARCLALLTLTRRTGAQASGTTADIVLSELTAGGQLAPRRDDRGVVLTLQGDALNADASTKIATAPIAAAAAAHPEYPVIVVAHTGAKPSAADVDKAHERAARVVRALQEAGIAAARVKLEDARGSLPIVAEAVPPARPSRNERVEVILVAPGS